MPGILCFPAPWSFLNNFLASYFVSMGEVEEKGMGKC
jgi:hypothetical protein